MIIDITTPCFDAGEINGSDSAVEGGGAQGNVSLAAGSHAAVDNVKSDNST